jgi:O-antigen ligase
VGANFPLSRYIPHNEIVWVLVKTGIVGFFVFWYFFNSFVVYGAGVLKRLRDPYLAAVCVVAVVAVVNQLVVSYVDMQLNWARNMAYLGLLFGLVPAVERIDADQQLQTPVA